jgi:opacity protein-like surface antigen
MKRIAATFASLVILFACVSARAELKEFKEGSLEGPYLTLEAGVMQMDYDRDSVSGQDVGRPFEPTIGFLFGWNLTDEFSTELQGRYGTNLNSGRRQHIASANAYAKWTFLVDELIDFKTLRILPFLKGGVASRFAILPGNSNANKNTCFQMGVGPSPGGGIAFIWKKYFMFGIDIQGDLLFVDTVRQTVNKVPNTLVYRGGFYPSFNAMAILGVHY